MKEIHCRSISPLLAVFAPRNKRASKILMQPDYQQILLHLEGPMQQFGQPPVQHLQPTECNHCKMDDPIYLSWQNLKTRTTPWCPELHVKILSDVFHRQTYISTTMTNVALFQQNIKAN